MYITDLLFSGLFLINSIPRCFEVEIVASMLLTEGLEAIVYLSPNGTPFLGSWGFSCIFGGGGRLA